MESNVLKWLAERVLTPETAAVVKRGIGDDMAIVRAGGADVLITTDMLLDGARFDLAAHGFRAVGRKALACSLSDCAAMAVQPLAATVSVALPAATRFEDVTDFYHGLRELADEFNTALVGMVFNRIDHGRPLPPGQRLPTCQLFQARARGAG